jgi:hypothetical protein
MLVYVLVLFVAETAWCYVGLRRLREPVENVRVIQALTYGVVRLLMGRTIMFLTQDFVTGVPEPAAYAFVLLPLRWLAWSLVAELIAAGRVRFVATLASDSRSNLWRLVGTLLCCAADLIALLNGYRVGEFWP